jgi:hypothetical protein
MQMNLCQYSGRAGSLALRTLNAFGESELDETNYAGKNAVGIVSL